MDFDFVVLFDLIEKSLFEKFLILELGKLLVKLLDFVDGVIGLIFRGRFI